MTQSNSKTPKDGLSNAAIAHVIISSDRASAGAYEDRSGPAVCDWLTNNHFAVPPRQVVADDRDALLKALQQTEGADLVVISGGTGLGPRDITPQVLEEYCDYIIPGFGEMLRAESLKYSLNSYLSRCGGYVRGSVLYLAIPGSPEAAVEQLGILRDLLPHALKSLKGNCDHRRPVDKSISSHV